MDIHKVDFKDNTVTWKCKACGAENPYDKETVDKALELAKESLKAIPAALFFGALKAIGWLCIGIAALKYVKVMKNKQTEFFMVTRVCRDDIASRFSDWDTCSELPKKFARIPDEDMQRIADEMGEMITECDFWTALDIAVKKVMGWKQ